MSLEWTISGEITSNAAAIITLRPIRTPGWPIDLQVITAPAAFINLTGGMSSDPAEYIALTDLAGAPITNVGVGFYHVIEQPGWMQISCSIDVGAPRLYVVAFRIRVEE